MSLFFFYFFLICITIPKNVLLYSLNGDWKNLSAFLRGIWWNVVPGTNEFEQLVPTTRPNVAPLLVVG
jgi:hypothetical protein